jgi:hypothetical protein
VVDFMTLDNPCEFIKGIHADPFKLVKNLTVKEYYKLKDHVEKCAECTRLLDDMDNKYKDIAPGSSPWKNTRNN